MPRRPFDLRRALAGLALIGASSSVHAEPATGSAPAGDAPSPGASPLWIYLDESTVPDPGRVLSLSRMTFTNPGSGASRPFAADLAHPGLVQEFGAEAGIGHSFSLWINGTRLGLPPDDPVKAGMMAGLRWALLSGEGTTLTASMGALRELGGSYGAWSRLSIGQEMGRARVGATVHAEHVGGPGRDDVDLMVFAGASYQVLGPLRLGVESFAQDIEEIGSSEGAEQGALLAAGPAVALELMRRALWIGASPSLGLSRGAPQTIGRFAIAYGF